MGFGIFPGAPIQSDLAYSGLFTPLTSTGISRTDVVEDRGRGVLQISNDGVDSWGLLARGGILHFEAPPILQEGSTLVPIGSNFYDVEGGAVWRRALNEHREFLISATGGSASDEPFDGLAQTVFQVNAFYLLPTDRLHSWIFVVNWSNNRQFLNYIPIPGAVYSISSEDQKFHASVGFPFDRISYEFAQGWLAKASFVGISQASAEVNRALAPKWFLYAGYDWGQRSWLRLERSDPLNRLFYDEQRAMLGVRAGLTSALSADLSGGYVFVRDVFEGHSYYSKDSAVDTLPAGWEFQLAIDLRDVASPPTPRGS